MALWLNAGLIVQAGLFLSQCLNLSLPCLDLNLTSSLSSLTWLTWSVKAGAGNGSPPPDPGLFLSSLLSAAAWLSDTLLLLLSAAELKRPLSTSGA